ncbi:MAG: hypothetical protein WBH73_08770 [Arcanobacterium sp.]
MDVLRKIGLMIWTVILVVLKALWWLIKAYVQVGIWVIKLILVIATFGMINYLVS